MLGRIYAIIFLFTIGFSFWYQKKYLDTASQKLHTQLNFENTVSPASRGEKFKIQFFQNGALKYSFRGDKIVYFSDYHFEAEGQLVYTSYDETQHAQLILSTNKAVGQLEKSSENDNFFTFGAHSRIKFLTLPEKVFFKFYENHGQSKNIFINMEKAMIQSSEDFESSGPQGSIKGKGFHYSIKDEEFKIKLKVKGHINTNKEKRIEVSND
jgi:lipopolysaccharide export system protein LptC